MQFVLLTVRAQAAAQITADVYLTAASSNVLVSGADDKHIKVWDRRSLGDSGRHARPSGHLVGHTEGITYVAPKGDGRFVLSNGKDQVRVTEQPHVGRS